MNFQTVTEKIMKKATTTFLLSTTILVTCFTGIAMSKGGADDNRSDYYGIIQDRPQNDLRGEWTIGNRIFMTDQNTEYDETEGPLIVGSCAKVHIGEGRSIHEIDSEPRQDCRN